MHSYLYTFCLYYTFLATALIGKHLIFPLHYFYLSITITHKSVAARNPFLLHNLITSPCTTKHNMNKQ